MPIAYPDILSETGERRAFSYSHKDAILYALGVGLGADPMDRRELAFVYENGLQVVPTAATVLGGGIMPRMAQKEGLRPSSLNFLMVVHGEQKVELHRPLAPADALFTQSRTLGAYDKGEGKGALIVTETTWTDGEDNPVATLTNSIFARGDGGFGGPSDGAPEPHRAPDRAPDRALTIQTRPDQAAIYRLSGDINPLHIDPDVAAKAGYPRPILHGLCTYGLTCRAVLQATLGYQADRIRSHEARFSAPLYPGEAVRVDIWEDGATISFEATAVERDVKVIRNGKTVLRD